jgi:hypothetical protein
MAAIVAIVIAHIVAIVIAQNQLVIAQTTIYQAAIEQKSAFPEVIAINKNLKLSQNFIAENFLFKT